MTFKRFVFIGGEGEGKSCVCETEGGGGGVRVRNGMLLLVVKGEQIGYCC